MKLRKKKMRMNSVEAYTAICGCGCACACNCLCALPNSIEVGTHYDPSNRTGNSKSASLMNVAKII